MSKGLIFRKTSILLIDPEDSQEIKAVEFLANLKEMFPVSWTVMNYQSRS